MSGKLSKSGKIHFILILILTLLIFLFSLLIGSYHISIENIVNTFLSVFFPSNFRDIPPVYKDIILKIRLPRILLSLFVGASLSVSGATLQALFKNPLVNEYILGISSGAAFGASLSIVFLGKNFPVEISAFIFAIFAFLVVIFIAGGTGSNIITLILTGVIVSSFFTALLTLVEFFANPYSLQSLFFWLMGSFSLAGWGDILHSFPLMILGLAALFFMRWRLNVLSLGEEEAKALGVNVRFEKLILMLATTLTTASAISVAGIIGWVGLIIPHFSRMIFGVNNRIVIPASALIGGSFLLLADDLSRGIASFEIPVGIFTSLIGIPFFIYFLKKSEKIWA
ncbi:MAG: FecCD family ABC transporter permease [Candidatus Aminicenantia bacterium]